MSIPANAMILFIIKQNHTYDGGDQMSSGLKNSAQFVVNMLLHEGRRARLVEAIDGNSIDALVSQNNPALVILEAIWVTPSKLEELQKLHPKIRWIVRVHSETPFLAMEGAACEWLAAYAKLPNVTLAFNSQETLKDFEIVGRGGFYLPNYYPLRKPRTAKVPTTELHIGCFGAIRPLKNQLIQAMAAIAFAWSQRRPLVFHMNGDRIEQNGGNVLKNIRAVLSAADAKFVLHNWAPHEEITETIATMDICLQVSLSESFNMTAADCVSMGVPLVGSEAIAWLPKRSQARTNSVESIAGAMERADATMVQMNHTALEDYLRHSVNTWNANLRALGAK